MMLRIRVILSLSVVLLVVVGCHTRKADETPPKPDVAVVPATPVQVELFVMSRCPYGVQAENALFPAIDQMGDAVDFHLHFIGETADDGSLASMHGESSSCGIGKCRRCAGVDARDRTDARGCFRGAGEGGMTCVGSRNH